MAEKRPEPGVLLGRIASALKAAYGPRLRGLVLFGSEARGDAKPDSDIDVLVLLDNIEDYGRDLRRNVEALSALSSELGRRISAKPADVRHYEAQSAPLYRRVRREGIAA